MPLTATFFSLLHSDCSPVQFVVKMWPPTVPQQWFNLSVCKSISHNSPVLQSLRQAILILHSHFIKKTGEQSNSLKNSDGARVNLQKVLSQVLFQWVKVSAQSKRLLWKILPLHQQLMRDVKRLVKHGAPPPYKSRREWFGRNKPSLFQ